MAIFWAELGFLVHVQNGDLIDITDAEIQEAVYAQQPFAGCYMYYFQHLSKAYYQNVTPELPRETDQSQ